MNNLVISVAIISFYMATLVSVTFKLVPDDNVEASLIFFRFRLSYQSMNTEEGILPLYWRCHSFFI